MFRALFLAILLATLMVNIIFLFAAKDKPPDLPAASTTLVSLPAGQQQRRQRGNGGGGGGGVGQRLFLRSNDFYDYSPANESGGRPAGEFEATPTGARRPTWPPGDGGGNGGDRSSVWTGGLEASEQPPPPPPPPEQRQTRAPKLLERAKHAPAATFAYDNQRRPKSAGATSQSDNTTTMGAPHKRARGEPPLPPPPPLLLVRVVSSKSGVRVTLNGSTIYQSGQPEGPADSASGAPQSGGRHSRRRRRRRRRHGDKSARPQPEDAGHHNDAGDNTLEPAARGIHVLVLNQFDASIMSKRLFDTYSPQQDDELALYLSQISEGRLLVLAVQDEASFKMARGSLARRLLRSMLGSRHIQELAWRDTWALVAVKRSTLETQLAIGERRPPPSRADSTGPTGNLAEAIGHSNAFEQWGRPVEIEARLELRPPEAAAAAAAAAAQMDHCQAGWSQRRRDFCARIEGYGRVCDCRYPSEIEFTSQPQGQPAASSELAHWQLGQVPIVVIAGNRPYYLYRMLRSLLQARGLNASLVTVFIDGFYEEPAEVCKLFQLRHRHHKPAGSRSARISNHYKRSLTSAFQELFPEARHAIVLEEDLDVAWDALLYFNQTLPLLERDPTLYCVSAWNDQGYEHSVGDLGGVYRVETMPGLGWMLSRELFLAELLPRWPPVSQQHDWDMWIRTGSIRRGRECLIPDVSRTFHFGSRGTNVNSYFQRQYFSKHAFSGNYLDSPGQQQLSGARQPPDSRRQRIAFKDLEQLASPEYDFNLARTIGDGSSIVISWHSNEPRQVLANATLRAELERDYLCSLANMTHYFNGAETGAGTGAGANTHAGYTNDNNNNNNNNIDNAQEPQPPPPRSEDKGGETSERRSNVIFVRMIDGDDFANWLQLAACWHLWDLDARGQHKSVWRLFLNGRPTLVVGHPASPFSALKPAQLVPFDLRPDLIGGGGGGGS